MAVDEVKHFSISGPQAQIGFNVSWKICLNLCSQRWLGPSLIIEIYLIALGLWKVKILLVFGCINSKILDLKKSFDYLYFELLSRRCCYWRWKKERILEEIVFYITWWDVVRICCSMIRIIFRNNSEKIVRRVFLNNFLKITESVIPTSLLKWFQT